jgi:hypothetical protein
MTYASFLQAKRLIVPPAGIPDPGDLNPMLFPFQRDIVRWALRRGRAAIWADCGLGKTPMTLEWSRRICEHTGGRVLILTPLAVAPQFVTEGEKFGVPVRLCRSRNDVLDTGVHVTNYDRIEKFDPTDYVGIVLDESSILKDHTSATRNALIAAFERTPFKLACTATPAPNDHVELGNHAEFLGVMSRAEMLSMFFVHDGATTQAWRLKGHAQRDYWRWLCSWAVNLRKPSDLGYSDDGFDLPPLRIHEHVVASSADYAREAGTLFALDARTLHEQRAARRGSLGARVDFAAKLANADPAEPWIMWCDLNAESEALAAAVRDSAEVRGSMTVEVKERLIAAFTTRETRALVSKPSICGWGMNWQHCSKLAFVGISHSFEAWYQAIRRSWRFGQVRPVDCHVITSEAEGAVVANLKRKQADAEKMALGMVEHMAEISRAELGATKRDFTDYKPRVRLEVPRWLTTGTE